MVMEGGMAQDELRRMVQNGSPVVSYSSGGHVFDKDHPMRASAGGQINNYSNMYGMSN